MKFFVEGGEEVGSPHVGEYVKAHRDELTADACIWETGGKNEADHFQVIAGLKGIVSFDLHVKTADADIHSSLAAYIDNAAWRLVRALSSLTDEQNHILIDGFYDDIEPLDMASQAAIDEMDFDADAIRKTYGLKRPFTSADPKRAVVTAPTLTINGLSAGYEGEGLKTIIPKEALAKLDCRLLPGQDPRRIASLIQAQLDKNGYSDVHLHYNLGEDAFHSDLNDPHLKLAKSVAEEVYGTGQVRFVPMMPGGGPADNAAWRLVRALSSLTDEQNHILIDGFYDDIEPLDMASQAAIDEMDFDADAIRKTYGLKRPFTSADPKRAVVTAPTLTINGLSAGYEGEGLKTIIPKEALAKLDCRLLPGQDPRRIASLIQAQLDKNGYSDVHLHYNLGEDAFHSDLNDPHLKLAKSVAEEVYGTGQVRFVPMMPGGGPAKHFVDALNLPVILIGVNYAGSGPHAPNENIRLHDYQQGVDYLIQLLNAYARPSVN